MIAALLAFVVSADAASGRRHPPDQVTAAQMMDDLMYGHGTIGGPFTLTDQSGRKRSDSDFRGKLMIVYFGYTFCPDVCPADLMAITQALDALGPAADGVQPIFITVDPERDTKLLAEYVLCFSQKPHRAHGHAGRNPKGRQCLQGILRQSAGERVTATMRSITPASSI